MSKKFVFSWLLLFLPLCVFDISLCTMGNVMIQGLHCSTPHYRFATLNSLKGEGAGRAPHGGSDGSSDEEGPGDRDHRQSFYVGGGERSGQQVLGPRGGDPLGNDPENIVRRVFEGAQRAGAEPVKDEPPASGASKQPVFVGRGRRLDAEDEPEIVAEVPAPAANGATATVGAHGKPVIAKTVKFWKDGFSIDDGELRQFDTPENVQFVEQMRRGAIPTELVRQHPGHEFDIRMEMHMNEAYTHPPMKPFSGTGARLGAPVPGMEPAPIEPEPIVHAPVASSVTSAPAEPKVNVDDSKPSGHVMLRLANGKSFKVKVNETHLVSDLRAALCDAFPEYCMRPFVFMTTFPKAQIEDESATVKAAKVINAVLVQRVIAE